MYSMRFVMLVWCCLGILGSRPCDAALWETVGSPTTSPLRFVVWGNGHWLAASTDEEENTTLIRSDNGVNWQSDGTVLKVRNTVFPVGRMFFTGGRFLIRSSYNGSDVIQWASSVDGLTWEPFPVPGGVTILDVTFAAGRWVCVGGRGTFASAAEPGAWTVDNSRITDAGLTRVIWFGDRFHAFGSDNQGLIHYVSSTPEALEWSVRPRSPILIGLDSLSSLETGSIMTAQSITENVLVITGNIQQFLVGRPSPDGITWTALSRPGFGRLFPRKSADVTVLGGFRHEWINPSVGFSPSTAVEVFKLRQNNETSTSENLTTSLRIGAVDTGPDAMIAVGDGGVIRRYPTGMEAVTAPVILDIEPAVQLKWPSRTGHDYLIESSPDGQAWSAWMPALAGTGQTMIWTQPAKLPRQFFRVREQ